MILDLKQDLCGPVGTPMTWAMPIFVGKILVFCWWNSNFGRVNPYFCWLIFTFCNTETIRNICTKTIPNWDFQPSKGQIPRPQPPSQPQNKTAPQLVPSVPSVPSACSTLFIFTKAHLRFRTSRLIRLILDQLGSWRPAATNKNSLVSGLKDVQGFVPLRPYQSTENVVGQQTFGVFRHPNGF